ncbi:MAG TPA: MarR family winged helix-turn-helix transcriptional regulator [Polyangia bacterium]
MGTQSDAQGGARPTKSDDRATRDVLDAIRRIVRALRESSRAAESAVGIGAAQLFVLHRLAASPALSLNELAARTFTHQSSVSVVVSRLVERGLLTRTRGDGDDGRRVAISVTPAGRALLARAPAAAQERLVAGLALLGAGPRRELAALLGRLVDLMALPDRSPPMFFESAPAGTRRTRKETKRRARLA